MNIVAISAAVKLKLNGMWRCSVHEMDHTTVWRFCSAISDRLSAAEFGISRLEGESAKKRGAA